MRTVVIVAVSLVSVATAVDAHAALAVNRVDAQVDLNHMSTNNCTASCSSGVLVGGGYAGGSDTAHLFVYRSERSATNTWKVSARNFGSIDMKLYCYANCLTGDSDASVNVKPAAVVVPPQGPASVSPTCDAGDLVVSGGFYTGSIYTSNLIPVASAPLNTGWDPRAWTTTFWNNSRINRVGYGNTYCLHNVSGTTYAAVRAVTSEVPPNSVQGGPSHPCGAAEDVMTGGGFRTLHRLNWSVTNMGTGTQDYWVTSSFNHDTVGHALLALGLCIQPD